MSDIEFDIIRRFFTRQLPDREDVIAGIGDDAALLQVPAGKQLVACLDTLVAGTHFPENTPAAAIGHKALAVNLSDLAAMGAEPAWATLSLTLPAPDYGWLEEFSRGFFELAERHDMVLVGGDTTRGPLSVTVQAHGFIPPGQALRRRGAQAGDRIYVTGTLGDAGLALRQEGSAGGELRSRLDFPEPRIATGLALRGHASAAIDVSDGLLADLGHLLEADNLGASVQLEALPRSGEFVAAVEQLHDHQTLFNELPLSAGDDYELCFTVPAAHCSVVEARCAGLPGGCTSIGVIEATAGIRCHLESGAAWQPDREGYRHFDGEGHG
jgi:thiamine-monophosphate kinase